MMVLKLTFEKNMTIIVTQALIFVTLALFVSSLEPVWYNQQFMSEVNEKTRPKRQFIDALTVLKVLVGTLFSIFIFYSFILPITDMDSMMHIKTGEYIVTNQTIPRLEDPFSFADDEVSFLGRFSLSQYWLAQSIIYKIFSSFGPVGLVVFQATVFTLIALVLWVYIRRVGFYLSMMVVCAVSLYLLVPYASVRPQILSFLFTPILIVLVERYKETGLLRFLLPMPFLMLIWSNMHGGFIYGIVVLLIYLFVEMVGPYLKDSSSLRGRGLASRFKYFAGFSVASILISGINPNGFNPFVCAFIVQYNPLMGFITEYQSPFELAPYLWGRGYFIYWAAIGLSGILALSLLRKRQLAPTLLVLFSAVLTTTALRYVPLFAVTSAPMIGLLSVNPEKRLSRSFKLGTHLLSMIVLGFMVFSANPFENRAINRFDNSPVFPANAVRFMNKNGISGNIFSSYNQAAYVFFGTYPESRIYLDGRNNNYERIIRHEKIVGGTDGVKDFFALINGFLPEGAGIEVEFENGERYSSLEAVQEMVPKEDWKSLLDEIGAEIIVHEAINCYSGELYPMVLKLIDENSWKLVYLDGSTMIFLRDNEKFRELIEKYNIPKRFILDEIILEGARGLGSKSPHHHASVALALLLKGDTSKRTRQIIDTALELDPAGIYANYADALYETLTVKRKKF